MRRFFAKLDSVPTHAMLSDVLNREQFDKWVVLDSLRLQLRISPNGVHKPQQYLMPETRRAYADYSVHIEPGDFGVLEPGETQDYAFRRMGNSAERDTALFKYRTRNRLYDRDFIDFQMVCEEPETYVIDFA